MKEGSDGLPETGPSARKLGVRPAGTALKKPDVMAVNPSDIVYPGQGGMSVAPNDPGNLPSQRRPVSLGVDFMNYEERFENALHSLEPLTALNSLVLELSAEGHKKAAILKIFENYALSLRKSNRESDEELLMEIMDALVGWCHPSAMLLPDEKLEGV
jgi:hypothetical protein